MKAPSKKIFTVLAACALAVGAIFFAVETSKERPTSPESIQNAVLALATEEKGGLDADGDGLRAWEEDLWTTDPQKADTDGDGTNDGEEVTNGRNPVLAGPNDAIASASIDTSASSTASTENLTTTDKYAREIFAKYLKYRQDNGPISVESQEQLVSDMLNSKTISALNTQKYLVTDLRIGGAEAADSLRSYGNKLGEIARRNTAKGVEDEFTIFGTAMQTGDDGELAKLDLILSGYKQILKEYLEMQVPRSAAGAHLNLVNATSGIIDTIQAMRNVQTDPVGAYIAVTNYPKSANTISRSLVDLKAYFGQRGITFEQQEDGYALFSII